MDAVLVANETVGCRQRHGKPGILCKLDIEKAFDNVNWVYLLEVLERMGFGQKWIHWIKFCMSTRRFSVRINGVPTVFVKAQKGLRQDDPLSLFLFLTAMKGLNNMIKTATSNGSVRSFNVARGGRKVGGDSSTICRGH
ncbi:putative jasmonate O-methyltransferase-like [Capsicum annuum]|nr:putative jasmonate O-methyltransferase-like [Capsicum annuum]